MSNIEIIFETDDVVVVNKPAGMLVHGDGRSEVKETVVSWFLAHCPDAQGVGEEMTSPEGVVIERSGVVHRLDGETSGVLVLAKTQTTYEFLKQQFQDRLVKKEYRAFVYGHMPEKWGTIDRSIGRSANDPRKRSAERGSKGVRREAQTDWELIGQGYVGENDARMAYVKLMPKTGRTHQLRVHLKSMSRPIVHDSLYAPPELLKGEHLGFSRLALHAYTLEVEIETGNPQRFMAPLPQMFIDAEDKLCS